MLVRIATALLLAPIFVFLTLNLSTFWFGVLLLLIVLIGLFEWNKLTVYSTPALVSSGIGLVLACWWLHHQPQLLSAICIGGACIWLFHTFDMYKNGMNDPYSPLIGFLVGTYCLFACWSGLVALHQISPGGRAMCIAVLIIVWAADSFAYFAGKRFGRNKLAPVLSPNKTFEGVVGGLVGALAIAWVGAQFLPNESLHSLVIWIGAGFLCAVFSIAGDLYQSRLKRNAGVKDSGSILPGHGGILDRIDGVIAAVPVFVTIWFFTQ